jgi:tRNA A37 N6-isopentenylltransferase MiaA
MNESLVFISSILTAVGGTGYFTFLFTRSKYKVDVLQAKENAETTAIDNDIKLSGHYKEILDDLKSRYESRYKEFEDSINRKVELLEEEIRLKDRKIKLQQQEINELKKENRILRAHAKTSLT